MLMADRRSCSSIGHLPLLSRFQLPTSSAKLPNARVKKKKDITLLGVDMLGISYKGPEHPKKMVVKTKTYGKKKDVDSELSSIVVHLIRVKWELLLRYHSNQTQLLKRRRRWNAKLMGEEGDYEPKIFSIV